MKYEDNKILTLLQKNSVLDLNFSKTTRSLYFYWRQISFRYSDHRTTKNKIDQYSIVFWYEPLGFMIKPPDKESYSWYSEIEAYNFLRKLEKEDRKSKKNKRKDPQKRKQKQINQILRKRRKNKKYKKDYTGED